jgi:hypothetical protein
MRTVDTAVASMAAKAASMSAVTRYRWSMVMSGGCASSSVSQTAMLGGIRRLTHEPVR